jgi:CMP/dCMP kinase
MLLPMTIAIDGPAASGKSTLADRLARDLKYLFFDTGVMYRALTWAVIKIGIPTGDEVAITRLAQQIQIDVFPPSVSDGRASDVLVDGQDVTWEIRQPEVDGNVSVVAAYPGVRQAMSMLQRRIGLRGRVVMVGRDIGTVILPEAEIKFYLDASVEERARRRYLELQARKESISYEDILNSLRQRDQIDSTRAVAPLCPAPDAIIINSDGMSMEQVLQKVKELIDRKAIHD